jgi:hypothetical protein
MNPRGPLGLRKVTKQSLRIQMSRPVTALRHLDAVEVPPSTAIDSSQSTPTTVIALLPWFLPPKPVEAASQVRHREGSLDDDPVPGGIDSWDFDLNDTLVRCYSYSSEGHIPLPNKIAYKTPLSGLRALGIALPPSQVTSAMTEEEYAAAWGVEAQDIHRIVEFAEALNSWSSPKSLQRVEFESYLLSPPGWAQLRTKLQQSPFSMTCLPKPANMYGRSSSCWLIDEKETPRIKRDWIIAVTDASAVLFILTSAAYDLSFLAMELSGRGVNFYTPMDIKFVRQHGDPVPSPAEYLEQQKSRVGQARRSPNYQFRASDYMTFLRGRASYLADDARIRRLAVLAGGVIRRLSLSQVGLQDVMNGPSPYAACDIDELRIKIVTNGQELVDDSLLAAEEGVLVGACTVGERGLETKSFFPLRATWDNHTYSQTVWSQTAEYWLLNRDQSYRKKWLNSSDDGVLPVQPCSTSGWRNHLGHHSNADKISKAVREDTNAFLASYVALQS